MKHPRGNILIEGMIAVLVTIIGLLSGGGVTNIGAMRARDNARVADVYTIATFLSTYNTDYGMYPESDGECPTANMENFEFTALGRSLNEYVSVRRFPKDQQMTNSILCGEPVNSYFYKSLTDRSIPQGGYVLAAELEIMARNNIHASEVLISDSIDGSGKLGAFGNIYSYLNDFDHATAKKGGAVFALTSR